MMRTHLLLIAAGVAMATGAIASPDVAITPRHAQEEGWHWYKDPAEIEDDDDLPPVVTQTVPPAPMSASEQKALL
ncbi:hypothetical protein COJ96_25865, partial [Bacillus sp. AFS073361]|uniref:hypothetical protein n=1 Tax=Bacillus sp. AFS073361 TaxID=2033511 RepID=UPI000C00676D